MLRAETRHIEEAPHHLALSPALPGSPPPACLAITQAGYTKVILRPLMVVAGDHANNDMAGEDEDSWMSIMKASGNFDSVEAQVIGLGSVEAIQKIYVEHTAAVID